MKTDTKFFPNSARLMHSHRGNILRLACVLLVTALCLIPLAGCGESSETSSSSSAASEDTVQSQSSPSSGSTSGAAASTASSKTPKASSSASSAPSDNGYVLPASSASRQNSSSSGSSVPETSSGTTSSQTGNTAKSAFDSLFGKTASRQDSEETVPDTSGSKVSEREYDRIENGMTYAEVKSVIGGEGKISNEFGNKNSDLYSITYRWAGNGVSGSYAEITFEKNVVSSKIQFGLN